jgi:hypothetical protein
MGSAGGNMITESADERGGRRKASVASTPTNAGVDAKRVLLAGCQGKSEDAGIVGR